jgi:hypothetical protein
MGRKWSLVVASLLVLTASACGSTIGPGGETPTVVSPTLPPTEAPSAVPAQPPAPTVPTWPLALEDDFDDPASGFGERSSENRRRFYGEGQYTIEVTSEDWIAWATRGNFFDFVLEVDVISGGQAGYAGLIFRKEGENQFYFFSISPKGEYRLRKWLAEGEENWVTILDWEESPHIETGAATNRLRVGCMDSEISLYVNDEYLATVEDETFTRGEIGMAAATLPEETHAIFHFDNLQVRAPGAVIQPTPSAVLAPILFEDDFSDPTSGWWTGSTDDGWVRYQDGELRMLNYTTAARITSSQPGQSFTDLVMEVESRLVDGSDDNWHGLSCRYVDSENYYIMQFSADGYYSGAAKVEGEITEFAEPSPSEAINLGEGATNVARLECVGSNLRFLVNGTLLIDVTDTKLTEGDIELRANSLGGEYSEIAFDNLVVSAPPEGVSEPPPTVVPPTTVPPTAVPPPADTPVAPTPAPPPSPAFILEDDFDQPGGARPLFGSEVMTFDYVSGEGRLTTTFQGGVLPAMYATPKAADFVAEFDFRAASAIPGSGYGLIFRSDDAPGGLAWYYQVLIRPADGTATFSCWKDGAWVLDQVHQLPAGLARPTGSNHVRVEAVGNEFTVFVNGTLVFEATDASLPAAGIFGLSMVSGIAGPDTVYFDNLVVSAPTAAPPPTAGPSIGSIAFAQEITEDLEPINPATTFPAGTTQVYALFDYRGMRDGLEFGHIWYRDGVQDIWESYAWDRGQSGTSGVVLSNPGGVLPGTYRLEIWVEGQLLQSGSMVVQ